MSKITRKEVKELIKDRIARKAEKFKDVLEEIDARCDDHAVSLSALNGRTDSLNSRSMSNSSYISNVEDMIGSLRSQFIQERDRIVREFKQVAAEANSEIIQLKSDIQLLVERLEEMDTPPVEDPFNGNPVPYTPTAYAPAQHSSDETEMEIQSSEPDHLPEPPLDYRNS